MNQTIGRYEIIKELGRGGMATVYLAKDPRFDRDVAVKILPSQFLHDPQFRARFEREAQTIAKLEHPSIVPVYDFGSEDDQPYIVMRYMQGGSLAEKIAAGPLDLNDSAEIVKRIASALDSAHQRGIVHRDLKPGNILFDQYNNAYLSDFGIVKLAESTQTYTGNAIVGTPAYMSPEQAQGTQGVDARTDVYALGVILFEMLTGTIPYNGDTPVKQLMQHIMEPIPRISTKNSGLPQGIEPVVDKSLAKEPDKRFSSTVALALALDGVTSGNPAAPASNTLVGGNQTLMGAAPAIAAAQPINPTVQAGATLVPDSTIDATGGESISYTPITGSGTLSPVAGKKKSRAGLWLLLGMLGLGGIGGGLYASGTLDGLIGGNGISAEITPTTQQAAAFITETATSAATATESPTETPAPTDEPTAEPRATDAPTETPAATDTPVLPDGPLFEITSEDSDLFSEADEGSAELAEFEQGAQLSLLASTDDFLWVQVQAPDGQIGWMKRADGEASESLSSLPVVAVQALDATEAVTTTTVMEEATEAPTAVPTDLPPTATSTRAAQPTSTSTTAARATNTPTPWPTRTPTPWPTNTPTPWPTHTPTPWPTKTPTPRPTHTPTPWPTKTPTPRPTNTATPRPTNTPTKSPPTWTPTPAASPTPAATATPTAAPLPTATPTSAAPAAPLMFTFSFGSCSYTGSEDYDCQLTIFPQGGTGPYTVQITDADPATEYSGVGGSVTHTFRGRRCNAWVNEVRVIDDNGTVSSQNIFFDPNSHGGFPDGTCTEP